MKKLLVLFTLILGLGLATAPVAAQSVDIEATAGKVLDADPEAISDGVSEAPSDDLLPDGFTNPVDGTPEAGDAADSLALPVSEIDGALASESYPLDADSSVVGGQFAFGNLNFVVLEEEVTEDQLADFKNGAEEGLGTPESGTTSAVEDIEVDGTVAVLITVTVEDSGTFATVQLVALPVGNVLVISTVAVADETEVDAGDVQAQAEELSLSGVAYLDEVADAA